MDEHGLGFFLASVGVLGGLSGLLALILVLAEKYIANYGTCKVSINDDPDVSFECDGGKNLLLTLAERKIFIPSACGGQGTCAYCKVKVLDGGGQVLPTERGLLTRAEIRGSIRLSCQVKVRNDLKIFIPPELLAVQEFQTVCEKIEALSHDTKLVRLRLVEPKEVDFKPGQYFQLSVPPDYLLRLNPPIFTPTFRAYSCASMPKERNAVEFIIRLVPNGICTTWVHRSLREGENVRMTGPYGEFYLNEESARPILCVGGGSGVAPIRSIVEHLFDRGTEREVHCFIGQRAVRDLYWYDVNIERAKRHANFHYIPALSGLLPGDRWEGETGFVHKVIEKRIPDPSAMEAYLCGPPIMIDAVMAMLVERGMPAERIRFDKFS